MHGFPFPNNLLVGGLCTLNKALIEEYGGCNFVEKIGEPCLRQ